MNKIKVIKTEKDYKEALAMVEELMNRAPEPGSEDADKLNLLATLVEDYESSIYPESLPDPIEAIKFRMEQAGLKPADLVPYIGTPGRVSEILSGKRQLTLDMVRAISAGLGIPSKVLIQKSSRNFKSQNWSTGLVRIMEQRGYFGKKTLKEYDASELINGFFAQFGNLQPSALYRKTSFRTTPRTDNKALFAWGLRVLQKAEKIKVPVKYKKGTVNFAFMQEVVRLSAKNKGPLLARDYLKKHGIKLVIEPHLPKTHLDGATLLASKDTPVVGLTIRHDRPDNFWFTLMHELAHVALHYDSSVESFYDEALQDKDGTKIDPKEKDADTLAEETILPKSKWETSAARTTPNQFSTEDLANELNIQTAVIAGMIQFKHQKFYYLNEMIHDESIKIRKYFPNEFKY
ncbi:MAG: ImmA/IrrE family metallo-endopeptidase [Candidatus Levybacteria bacterium]|nr:ImmA/IrrE family metallo-endopeptidase [Candidatus Levybacteria bacterium]